MATLSSLKGNAVKKVNKKRMKKKEIGEHVRCAEPRAALTALAAAPDAATVSEPAAGRGTCKVIKDASVIVIN